MVPRSSILAAIALLLFGSARVEAQDPAAGRLTGRVIDSVSGSPRAGIVIVLDGTAARTTTDPAGRFAFARIAPGTYVVTTRALGYRSVQARVQVTAGDSTVLQIRLVADAAMLEAISTQSERLEREQFRAKTTVATVAITPSTRAGLPRLGEADLVRTVQLMPGVSTRGDFSAGYNVRGGESSQNLVLLDGIPLLNPFHLGGLFSTFIDAAAGTATLHSSGFPARFGGRLSSVLEVESAAPTAAGIHGSVDVSVVASTGHASGTFAGGRGGWILAARRTYADHLARAFTDEALPYHFMDAQAHARYESESGTRWQATLFTGNDVLEPNLAEGNDSTEVNASNGAFAFRWGNRAAGVGVGRRFQTAGGARWLGDSLLVVQRLAYSGFSALLSAGDRSLEDDNRVSEFRASGVASIFAPRSETTLGYEVSTSRVDYSRGSPGAMLTLNELRQRPTGVAVHAQNESRVHPDLLLQTGVRVEALAGRSWWGVSPRVAAKLLVDPSTAVSVGIGRATQWLHSLGHEDAALQLFDYWIASDATLPVASAWHYLIAAERWLGSSRFVRAEGFYKRYDRVLEYDVAEDETVHGDEFVAGTGESFGADLLVRQLSSGPITGWLAYTFAISRRNIGEGWFPPAHDRRHDVNLVAQWRAGKYLLGGRFGFATGRPFTPMVGQIVRREYDPTVNAWGTGNAHDWREGIGGVRNSARYPATQRLDLSVTRDFHWRGSTIAPYLSVVNAYNARNVWLYVDDYSTAPPTRSAYSQLPILPTMGAAVRF